MQLFFINLTWYTVVLNVQVISCLWLAVGKLSIDSGTNSAFIFVAFADVYGQLLGAVTGGVSALGRTLALDSIVALDYEHHMWGRFTRTAYHLAFARADVHFSQCRCWLFYVKVKVLNKIRLELVACWFCYFDISQGRSEPLATGRVS